MYALVLTVPTERGCKVREEVCRGRKLEYIADLALDSHRTRRAYQQGRVALCRIDADGEYGRLSPGETREVQYRLRTGEWPV